MSAVIDKKDEEKKETEETREDFQQGIVPSYMKVLDAEQILMTNFVYEQDQNVVQGFQNADGQQKIKIG